MEQRAAAHVQVAMWSIVNIKKIIIIALYIEHEKKSFKIKLLSQLTAA